MPGQSDKLEQLMVMRELQSLGISEADAKRLIAEREAALGSPWQRLTRDVTRRLGLANAQGEVFPESDITVNVTAPAPPHQMFNDPGTGRITRTILGTQQEKPTGSYVPRNQERVIGPAGTNLPPRINDAWNRIRAAHPYASRSIDAIEAGPTAFSDSLAETTRGKIVVNPEALGELTDNEIRAALLHEMTHIQQQNVAPDEGVLGFIRRWKGWDFSRNADWPLPVRPYRQQIGEAQGYDVGGDAATAPPWMWTRPGAK